jgi:hypothetical protein
MYVSKLNKYNKHDIKSYVELKFYVVLAALQTSLTGYFVRCTFMYRCGTTIFVVLCCYF